MAKIGEGTLAAMGRLGLKELRNAVNPSRESVADSELGMYGTATPGQIDASIGKAAEQEPLTMDGLRSAAQEAGKGMDEPGMGMDGQERGGRGR